MEVDYAKVNSALDDLESVWNASGIGIARKRVGVEG
jgi:hypothetical protein